MGHRHELQNTHTEGKMEIKMERRLYKDERCLQGDMSGWRLARVVTGGGLEANQSGRIKCYVPHLTTDQVMKT